MAPNDYSGRRTLILAALILPLCGCKKAVPLEDGKPVITVQAAHPTEGPLTNAILADAILAPQAQAALQARVTAPVRAFYVERGAKVKVGQLLATLENQDLVASALDNKGTYTAARGTYTATTRQQVPQEETQARLDLEQARSTVALEQSILDARTQLFSQGAIPGRDVDTARATAIQAEAAFAIAEQKFDSIKRVGKSASLEIAQGQLTSAKGKYLGAEAQLSYTSIRTPISGIVTDRPLFAGETAAAGTAIITVMDTSVLIAKLHIAQPQAQQLALGGDAIISIPGQDEPVRAKVSLISPALDPGSTTVEVWLKVPNADGRLKAGTAVHATIQGRTIPRALAVPADAVQRSAESGGKMVMVIASDGTAHKRNVSVGISTAESVQITDGLTLTDTIITNGGYGLDDGTKIKVEEARKENKEAKPAAGEKE